MKGTLRRTCSHLVDALTELLEWDCVTDDDDGL